VAGGVFELFMLTPLRQVSNFLEESEKWTLILFLMYFFKKLVDNALARFVFVLVGLNYFHKKVYVL